MSSSGDMLEMVELLLGWLMSLVKPRRRIEVENLVLRHQVNILRRKAPRHMRLSRVDRPLMLWMDRLCPVVIDAVAVIKPETLVRWHRRGFRAFWRWKSRSRGGRPAIPRETRDLIREMSRANWLWGAPRIHGELLKLGIDVAQSTVAKYMVKRPRRPGQTWRTFLHNHADGIAAMDLFIVPTIGLKLLYCLVILSHRRRRLPPLRSDCSPDRRMGGPADSRGVSWDETPRYLLRDRDGVYGQAVKRRLRRFGIRDRPVGPRSPWQNGHVERMIGSIRRECIDHVIVFGEAHLRRLMAKYAAYYNVTRTHLSLAKDAPISRPIDRFGRIIAEPLIGGLHHRYARI